MSRQWKCAVVGTGTVGKSHVRVVPQLDCARLVAICDTVPDRARAELAKNNLTGIPVYNDMGAMLAKEDIDVIHLATPSGGHMELTVQAMQAGKHVICEKPLDVTVERVDAMIEAGKKHNAKLACVFQGRWKDENRAIKEAVEQGRFGTISWAGCFTPWHRPDKYYEDVNWRGTWKWDGGGALMNQGVHAVDLLQWIVGPVRSVSAYGGRRIHPRIETEDTVSVALEFENGAFGSILASTAMFPGMPTRIEIGGENGTAVSENGLKMFSFREARDGDNELLENLAPGKQVRAAAQSTNAGISQDLHGRNLRAILGAWAEGREAETYGPEARKAVAMVCAIYESNRKGGMSIRVK